MGMNDRSRTAARGQVVGDGAGVQVLAVNDSALILEPVPGAIVVENGQFGRARNGEQKQAAPEYHTPGVDVTGILPVDVRPSSVTLFIKFLLCGRFAAEGGI